MTDVRRGALSNAAWNAFSTLSSIIISFVIAPLLINKLGADKYGILLLIWSLTGVLGLVGFGFGEATLRFVARYLGEGSAEGVNRILSTTLTFYLAACAVVWVVLFASAPLLVDAFRIPENEQALVEWLVRLAAVIFTVRAVAMTYVSVPMALQRYDVSSKITIGQAVLRSAGYIVLALLNFGLLQLVLWDLLTQMATVAAQAIVVRRMAPQVQLIPRLSFAGLREILGFSIFSFLTYAFHMMHRESGKFVLGAYAGPTYVAYLGTPDNVSQRIHMIVASGSETLMPRFSAEQDMQARRSLFWLGSWASLAISLVLLVPFVVLLPDFLRLWINPDFASESAALGQLVALSYISQGAYAPGAAYFRGIGRPELVTVVVAFAGLLTLGLSLLLVPRYGAIGVGYAYLCGSIPALLGTVHASIRILGRSAVGGVMRLIVLPAGMGAIAWRLQTLVRDAVSEPTWIGLFLWGGGFALMTGVLVFGADWIWGGQDTPSKALLTRLGESRQIGRVMGLMSLRKAR